MTTTRLGIAIDLHGLEALIDRYKQEELSDDLQDDNLLRKLYLSHFLAWVRRQQRQQQQEAQSHGN